ncbi:MAG TPA: adenosylcobinamide kinase/adenosylcobinamide phosphate guanyltransferase, partial [Devosia sp.]|nr:adenosylcobinamide kinase/adenosylcobinamide phosphate guanyltransferase [Devosia sp.]
ILVDCLTVWLSTIRFSADNPSAAALPPLFDDPHIISLLNALEGVTGARVILVSNEVGMGIVPDNRLARRFRDEAGELHQVLGGLCDCVNLVVAGLALPLKGPCLT